MNPPPAPEARAHRHAPEARTAQIPGPSSAEPRLPGRPEPSPGQTEPGRRRPGGQDEEGRPQPAEPEGGSCLPEPGFSLLEPPRRQVAPHSGLPAQVPGPTQPDPRRPALANHPTTEPSQERGRPAPRRAADGIEATQLSTTPDADLLHHPDPHTAAQAAAVENLLRCWVREHDLTSPQDHGGVLHIPLPATGTTLLAPVHYWSPTGWHRFGLPHLAGTPGTAPPVDAVTLAALLAREATARGTQGTATSPRPTAAPTQHTHPAQHIQRDRLDLVGRVSDSARQVAVFITERRAQPADDPDRFLAAEQALLLGHPLHPTPKSREGLSESEVRLYSPEMRGSFPVHWMAVAPSVLSTDSAWTERGRVVPADLLTARLAGPDLPLPNGFAALPLHPWQFREVRHRPAVAALLDAGLLRDLGPHGAPWHPTSSVRTVHRTGAPAMLKLSLSLRITNSRRENLRKELHRGVEVHRLLRTGLADRWQAAHPGFDIVRDPAWLAVTAPDGDALAGLDVVIRHNPFGPADDVSCVAGLVSPGPYPHGERHAGDDRPLLMRSRLQEVVTRLAERTGRPRSAVAVEWFLRYLEHIVRPVLWLDSEAGIALEAHQQNTLVLLDPDGWPIGGRYRDNQGYYFRASRRADLRSRLPGIGERSDTFVSDEVTDERFAYYLGINNVLGLIGAFGSQRLVDERLLLAAFRRFLMDVATGPARLNTNLPARLLDSPVLRCKANLLTRLHGLDELVGPVDTQSVYVTITNPLRP